MSRRFLAAVIVLLGGCTGCPTGTRTVSFEQVLTPEWPTACPPFEPLPVTVHDGYLVLIRPTRPFEAGPGPCTFIQRGTLRRAPDGGPVEEITFGGVIPWASDGTAEAMVNLCRWWVTPPEPREECCGDYVARLSQ